jgi:predicted permease
MSELRFALRSIARRPGFALLAGLSLAIGIGANAAIYSVIDAVMLRPMPGVARAERLVSVVSDSVSYPAYRDFRDSSRSLTGVVGFQHRDVSILANEGARVGVAGIVSGNFFGVLGTPALVGRTLQPSDDTPQSEATVAVISHRFWQQRFAAAADAVGQTVRVNGVSFRIVGVAPAGFRGATLRNAPDLWVPVHAWPALATGGQRRLELENRNWGWILVAGRLGDGVSIAEAEAELNVIAAREPGFRPEDAVRVRLAPAGAAAAGGGDRRDLSRFLALLAGIVGVALLMACANVANLMMVRVTGRRRELAIRLAVGAGRARIVRLLLAESFVLSVASGGVALLAAAWVMDLFRTYTLPGGIPLADLNLRFDMRFVLVALGLSLGAGLVFGLAPALHSSRGDMLASLKDTPPPYGGHAAGRQALVGIQVALCLILLAGAALFVRSVRVTLGADLGFDVNHIASVTVSPQLERYDAARTRQVLGEIRERLQRLPGVKGASWTALLPLTGDRMRESVDIEGRPRLPRDQRSVRLNAVGAGYFGAMGIPMRAGRDFADSDGPSQRLVAIVNETMAKRFWNGSPIGARVQMMNATFEIVGVAADATYEELGLGPVTHIYVALAQAPESTAASLILRTERQPGAVLAAIREATAAVARDLPASEPGTFRERFAAILMPQRFAAALLSLFGSAALSLAAVGIYGVTAYTVARRTREIGIRLALGAARRDVLRVVIAGTIWPVAAGAVAGLGTAALLAPVAARFLPGIRALDPIAFVVAPLVLLVLALASTAVPLSRAFAIDPASALRTE